MSYGTRVVIGALIAIVTLAALGRFWQTHRLDAQPAVEYRPTATIRDLMVSLIDPSADDVWNAVITTVDASGIEEKEPRSDEEWAAVRHGAIRLVEGANLLLIPGRRMARPGEVSETPGIELEPYEMEALVEQDPAAWRARATALREASLEVLQAVEAKDVARLFELGDRLDTACENCHRQYWYPNEEIPEFPADVSPQGAGG